jgi:hypothetical protein
VSYDPFAIFASLVLLSKFTFFCAVHKHSVVLLIHVTCSNKSFFYSFGNIVPTARHFHVELSFISLLSEIDPALPLAMIYLLYRLDDKPNALLELLCHVIVSKY